MMLGLISSFVIITSLLKVINVLFKSTIHKLQTSPFLRAYHIHWIASSHAEPPATIPPPDRTKTPKEKTKTKSRSKTRSRSRSKSRSKSRSRSRSRSRSSKLNVISCHKYVDMGKGSVLCKLLVCRSKMI